MFQSMMNIQIHLMQFPMKSKLNIQKLMATSNPLKLRNYILVSSIRRNKIPTDGSFHGKWYSQKVTISDFL